MRLKKAKKNITSDTSKKLNTIFVKYGTLLKKLLKLLKPKSVT